MVKKLLLKAKTHLLEVEEKKRNITISCCSSSSSSTTTTDNNPSDKFSSPLRAMDHHHPKLSLGPSPFSKSEESCGRKRKQTGCEQPCPQTSIDFHLNDPLPLDWEQCLDLQTGKMYYLNRKTLKKSRLRPNENSLDLELNISLLPNSESCKKRSCLYMEEAKKPSNYNDGGGIDRSSMVAIVCFNCHLLVMLYRSSPSCPNCKYMHSLPMPPPPSIPVKIEDVKSFETLSLLH